MHFLLAQTCAVFASHLSLLPNVRDACVDAFVLHRRSEKCSSVVCLESMEEGSLQALPLAVVEDRAIDAVRARKHRQQRQAAVQDMEVSTSRDSPADLPMVGSLGHEARHRRAADAVAAVSSRGGPASTSQPSAGSPGGMRKHKQVGMHERYEHTPGEQSSKGPNRTCLAHAQRRHPYSCSNQERAGRSGQTGTNWWAPHEPEQDIPQHSRASCHPHNPALHDLAQMTWQAASEQQPRQRAPPQPMHAQAGQHGSGPLPWLLPRSVAVALSGQQPQLAAPPLHTPAGSLRAPLEQPCAPQLSVLHSEIESFARQAMPTQVCFSAQSKISGRQAPAVWHKCAPIYQGAE